MFDICTFAKNFNINNYLSQFAKKLKQKTMKQNNNNTEEMNNEPIVAEEGMEVNTNSNVSDISQHPDPETETGIEKIKLELLEQKDKYIRLFAEFDNYKRRSAKERLEQMQTAGKEVIVSILDVLDDCDRAEKQMNSSKDIATMKEGVQLVFNKLRNTMHSKGLKAMESIHTEFDVEKHEAITEIPAPTDELKDKVIDEVQKGYYLNDKIIRFAKVVVGK
jgi:molecular chaperone GrpE